MYEDVSDHPNTLFFFSMYYWQPKMMWVVVRVDNDRGVAMRQTLPSEKCIFFRACLPPRSYLPQFVRTAATTMAPSLAGLPFAEGADQTLVSTHEGGVSSSTRERVGG